MVPTTFTMKDMLNPGEDMTVQGIYLFYCIMCGLWGGLIIGLVTEIYTSNAWRPVQEVAEGGISNCAYIVQRSVVEVTVCSIVSKCCYVCIALP